MARPLRIQFPGACYHITCRGIERRRIFASDQDRKQFLALLAVSLETYQVTLFAYTLMRNHFHLLIQTRKANCSEFMRHFNICYTGWFNWRYQRSGNLYQGRYKAFLVDVDSYLLEVSRYLHMNRVRVRRMRSWSYQEQWRYLRSYPWSSLPGYLSERDIDRVTDYDFLLDMVGGRRRYRDFIRDGLRRGVVNPFHKVKYRFILGTDDFVKEVKQYLSRVSRREQPSYRGLVTGSLEPEVVLGTLEKECGISFESLSRRGTHGMLRGIIAELLYRYCEITQGQIGQILGGIDYVSVHQLRRRLKAKMTESTEVRERFTEIETRIKALCTM